jgi:farnesyl diphosphate synthase
LRIEQALERLLPDARIHPGRLHEGMRYAVLDGGKRIRPVLVYAAGAVAGADPNALDAPACAVELIHAYSLVHDDLPAMDDDDLRRGKPTCHRAFDEATAILVGDALQALAFQALTQDAAGSLDATVRLRLVETLSQAAGSRGMVGGQAIDLAATGGELNLAELENMHIHKTGALIRASVLMGAFSKPDVDDTVLRGLDGYGKRIGLAFQIQDDILDVISDTKTLGKPQGTDQTLNKPTYPALLGLDGARRHAELLYKEAIDGLDGFGAEADLLRWLATYIVNRDR